MLSPCSVGRSGAVCTVTSHVSLDAVAEFEEKFCCQEPKGWPTSYFVLKCGG